MYGILSQNPGQERLWGIDYFTTVASPKPRLDAAQLAARHAAVDRWAKGVPHLAAPELAHVRRVAEVLPEDGTDTGFLYAMALVHARLPEPVRREREARIGVLARAHVPVGPQLSYLEEQIDAVTWLSTLVPDAALEPAVRDMMAMVHLGSHGVAAWQRMAGWVMDPLHLSMSAMGLAREPIAAVMINVLFTRPWAEWRPFLDLIQRFAGLGLGHALVAANAALDLSHLVVARGDLLLGVMEDCVRAREESPQPVAVEPIIHARLAQVRDDDEARTQYVMAATLDATRTGCWFGEVVTPRNQAVLAAFEEQLALQALAASGDRLDALHRSVAAAPVRSPTDTADAPPDVDPVHTWSVRRLVQWIGGDMRAPRPRRLDRAALLKRENEQRKTIRARVRNAPAVRDLTAEDIDLTVQDALSATAGFLLGELDDMLFRARSIGVDAAVIAQGAALLAPLKAFGASAARDDAQARDLLCHAEEAVARLRGAIRAASGDQRLRQRFERQLLQALLDEPLAEGKRHGGVIACPLGPADWFWVNERYHQRWWRTGKRLFIDGTTRQLRPDEALGLYVTGRSLSGYFFDVSVHLWQRKPGCGGLPAVGAAPFSPINRQAWVDTLVPCAVLHVEAAR